MFFIVLLFNSVMSMSFTSDVEINKDNSILKANVKYSSDLSLMITEYTDPISMIEIKDYKDAISALPEKKIDENNAANDATNDDIINDINAILDDMYSEDTSDIDTDDLNADTNIIEDETNYTTEEQYILDTSLLFVRLTK